MSAYQSTMLERANLTFCVDALQAREELLFKAFLRLLDHLTNQQWRYQAPGEGRHIDLVVMAEGTRPMALAQAIPAQLLQLGAAGSARHGYLAWPLKPDELEKELNRLGGQAMAQRAVQAPPALFTGAESGAPIALGMPITLMRLQQWPPTRLLAGPGRMRLATLLTGKAMTLDELVYRSALPLAVCKAFVTELQHARLLVAPGSVIKPAQQAPVLTSKPPQPGLLARIRLRFGIA